MGCNLRNIVERHYDRDSRRPGTKRHSGDICSIERERDSANDRPLDWSDGNARSRRFGKTALAFGPFDQPGRAATCAVVAAHYLRRLVAREFAEFNRRRNLVTGHIATSFASLTRRVFCTNPTRERGANGRCPCYCLAAADSTRLRGHCGRANTAAQT